MKWYEENYVNRRDWVLDHLQMLSLTPVQTVVVLMIDFMNEHHMPISIDDLIKRTGFSEDLIEQTVDDLCVKKYLSITGLSGVPGFHLDGLFETNTDMYESVLDKSLIDLFETEMGRMLSPNEMRKISEWNRTYDKQMIIYALRRASAYNQKSMVYIDRILSNWKEKGVDVDMIENGKA